MAGILPPYTKLHIIVLGSITVIAGAYLLFVSPLATQPANQTVVSEVSAEELKQDFNQAFVELENNNAVGALLVNNVLVIDIRSQEEYNQAHITGAENLHPADLKGALFSSDLNIVLHGNNAESLAEAQANLSEYEIASIQILNEDISTLEGKGYPITK